MPVVFAGVPNGTLPRITGPARRPAPSVAVPVKLSPEFAEAHTNLAAQYLRLGQYEQARGQSTLAMEIAGRNTRDLTNLATAVLALGCGLSLTGLLAHVIDIATFSPTLATLIGLGVGIDYSLFVVTRHRNAKQIPGLVLFRWDAPLFFANAELFKDRVLDVAASATPRALGFWARITPLELSAPPF